MNRHQEAVGGQEKRGRRRRSGIHVEKRIESRKCVIFVSVFSEEIKPGNSASSTRVGHYYLPQQSGRILHGAETRLRIIQGTYRSLSPTCGGHFSVQSTSKLFFNFSNNSNELEHIKTNTTNIEPPQFELIRSQFFVQYRCHRACIMP